MSPVTSITVGPIVSAPEETKSAEIARRTGAVIAATALVAICAHVSIALPFTPVPIVLSDMAVVLAGLLLGPWMGSAALLLYLAEGAAGMPVFSPHGPGGLAQMLGPTGGFLLSYPLVAFVAGWLFDRLRTRLGTPPAAVLGALAGAAPLFFCGAAWLALLLHLSAASALRLAVLPFLPVALVKIFVAAALIASLYKLRSTRTH